MFGEHWHSCVIFQFLAGRSITKLLVHDIKMVRVVNSEIHTRNEHGLGRNISSKPSHHTGHVLQVFVFYLRARVFFSSINILQTIFLLKVYAGFCSSIITR